MILFKKMISKKTFKSMQKRKLKWLKEKIKILKNKKEKIVLTLSNLNMKMTKINNPNIRKFKMRIMKIIVIIHHIKTYLNNN